MEPVKYTSPRRTWPRDLALSIAGGLATELVLWAGRIAASLTGLR
ncbi:hypothetical protein [Streptomyces sp. TBY4]|nr:hypothetical protein [Streptomyces sp. TBY4]